MGKVICPLVCRSCTHFIHLPRDRLRQWAKVECALDVLEQQAKTLANADEATIGEIAIAVALGYLDFRFAGKAWAKSRPELAKWYTEGFLHRASFVSTRPPE